MDREERGEDQQKEPKRNERHKKSNRLQGSENKIRLFEHWFKNRGNATQETAGRKDRGGQVRVQAEVMGKTRRTRNRRVRRQPQTCGPYQKQIQSFWAMLKVSLRNHGWIRKEG
jgi:hypothetical protein